MLCTETTKTIKICFQYTLNRKITKLLLSYYYAQVKNEQLFLNCVLILISVLFLNILQESQSAPYKVILHNKRFMKVPRSKFGRPAYNSVVGKDSWEDDLDSHDFTEDRHTY